MNKPEQTIILRGPCSTFGGPEDKGVGPDEGLAMFPNGLPVASDPRRHLFLAEKPVGIPGLARRLDPGALYCAFRYPYHKGGVDWREWLKTNKVTIRANGLDVECQCVDWGPHESTGRVVDLSPGAARALRVKTDDAVEVVLNRGL